METIVNGACKSSRELRMPLGAHVKLIRQRCGDLAQAAARGRAKPPAFYPCTSTITKHCKLVRFAVAKRRQLSMRPEDEMWLAVNLPKRASDRRHFYDQVERYVASVRSEDSKIDQRTTEVSATVLVWYHTMLHRIRYSTYHSNPHQILYMSQVLTHPHQ